MAVLKLNILNVQWCETAPNDIQYHSEEANGCNASLSLNAAKCVSVYTVYCGYYAMKCHYLSYCL